MTEKKKLPILIGILLVAVTITVGTTFALWQLTLQQSSTNVITTGCFEVTFTDANPINLEKAYPITDEEGLGLTPYEFTIRNTCNSLASYQINLEVLNTTTLTDLSYINSTLNESTKTASPKLLTTNETVTKTLTDATTSFKLETGQLNANESKTYNLRLWLDEDTPTSDTYMNKTFQSKITIITSYLKEIEKTPAEETKDYILSKTASDIIEDDETNDHNLRYIGKNPSNYIDIGDKDSSGNKTLWRVIGLMNNIDDGTGKKESRLKIIRANSFDSVYSWDSSESGVNNGFGVNEWSVADANVLLNDYYYNSKDSVTCYNASNNYSTSCFFGSMGSLFNSSGLSAEAKGLIGETVWHTGTNGTESESNILTNKFYELERSDNTGKICSSSNACNDTVSRTTTWKGMVGFMYPSDYGYATSGGSSTNRETCLNTVLFYWNNVSDCYNNNWLYKSYDQLTLSPATNSNAAHNVFMIRSEGTVRNYDAGGGGSLSPTVYLKTNITITGGEGTSDSPFTVTEK